METTSRFRGGATFELRDNLGRVVTVDATAGVTYKDSNGITRTISFTYTNVYIAPTFSLPTNNNYQGIWVHPFPPETFPLLASITLPNLRSYAFTYNTFGELTQINYPTGGYTKYEYGAYIHRWANGPNETITRATFRELTARKVCREASGSCGTEDTTTYAPTIPTNYEANQFMDVRDPLGNRTQTEHWESSYFDTEGIKHYALREINRYEYSGESTLLRTTHTDYDVGGPSPWALPGVVTTTLNDSNQKSKIEWSYDTYTAQIVDSFGHLQFVTRNIDNLTENREYDYGSGAAGALVRRTVNSWLKVNPVNGQNYQNESLHIMDRKATEAIYDGAGNLKAQSQFEYDSYAEPTQASGADRHDPSFNTSYTTRGNLTASKRWRNTDGALLETRHRLFDDAGNVLKTTDPLTHPTLFSYADSWGNASCLPLGGNAAAYVTSITNALGHVTHSAYNSCSGTVASTTDPNNKTTDFAYDVMNRLVRATLPPDAQGNRGQTDVTFNDPALPLSVTNTTKITPSMNLVSTVTVDGLGRETLSSLDSDPQGVTRTKTEYDALGRKKRSWNPTRCSPPESNCGESTWGFTDFEYDALGRTTKVIPPDGSGSTNFVLSEYSGNMVTVTDQAGKQRRSWTDALGRLIQVNEPNLTLATPAWTQYTYDTLDNLTNVLQSGSRQRTFTYNSLSQLLTATNPESGAISYSYDADGNLLTKTDARGITTTHSYDALHRLTQKTYNDGTRTVGLFYDLAIADGIQLQYPIGRLVKETDYVNVARYLSYDPMGRLEKQWVALPSGSFSYTEADYDFVGNPTYITYPSGRKVTYGYNTAAQLTRVTFDSWNGQAVNYNHLNNATYAPHGAPSSFPLGNGITETSSYNNRLQPAQLSAASSILTALNFSYNFYDAQSRNNGNVMAINDQLNSGRTQTFTYDQLNRLSTAQSAATSGTDCWGLQFGYDVWANLLSASTTKCSPPNLALTINAQNRIADPGYQYDAAGNLTTEPGMSYQYDAENRMKSWNTTGATYTYDAGGQRVRKQVGSDSTEYIYFGGQTIAERAANGDWSDYIYAGGRRLARADSYEDRIRTWATHCSNCSYTFADFAFPNAAGYSGYVIQPGDKLYWRQYQSTGARGGIYLGFTDGTYTAWITLDQDGQITQDDAIQATWHYRRVDLSAHAGKTLNHVALRIENDSAAGYGEIYYQDIVIASADGTVRPMYNRQKTVSLSSYGAPGMTDLGYEVNRSSGIVAWPEMTTNYYHGDHLGSSRVMTGYNGYPVWQATYLPFGQEWNPQATENHFKFTGKERDAESSLDYFIARYYSSNQDRFLSPDEFAGGPVDAFSSSDPLPPGPLPYAEITNPQSLNKYAYAYNSPLHYVDPNGHDVIDFFIQAAKDTVVGGAKSAANVVMEAGNFVNTYVDAGLAATGSEFRFGQMKTFEPSTPGEKSVMLGADFAIAFIPGGGVSKSVKVAEGVSVVVREEKVVKSLEIVAKYTDRGLRSSAAKAEKSIAKHLDLLKTSAKRAYDSIMTDIRKAAERLEAIRREQARRAAEEAAKKAAQQ